MKKKLKFLQKVKKFSKKKNEISINRLVNIEPTFKVRRGTLNVC